MQDAAPVPVALTRARSRKGPNRPSLSGPQALRENDARACAWQRASRQSLFVNYPDTRTSASMQPLLLK